MNKRAKGIVLGSSVLVLLGGALVALKLTEPPEPEESSEQSSSTEVPLWAYSSDEVSKVTVEQPDGDTYAVNRKMEKVDDVDAEGNAYTKDVANYYLEGYEDIPMDTTGIRLLSTRATAATAVDTVQTDTPESDLARFGLDDPIKVTLNVDGQDDIVFLIGDICPESLYSYISLGNDTKTIYTISSSIIAPYRDSMMTYLGTQLTEEQAAEDTSNVQSVKVERADLDYDFQFEYEQLYDSDVTGGSSAQHIMTEPVRCLLNAEKSAKATHGLYGLAATEVVLPHPTKEDLAKFGLDEPFVTVTSRSNTGKKQVFTMGNTYQTEGDTPQTLRYGYLKGIDCVYGFSAENAIYADMKPEDLTSKLVIETYVWDIGKLTYKTPETTLDFDIVATNEDDAVVKVNGEETDKERYRLLYTSLLQTSAEDLVLEDVEPTEEPMVSIYLARQDGKKKYTVDFYDAGGMKAYIAVDGKVYFKCRKSYVETLASNISIYFDTDKEFVKTW